VNWSFSAAGSFERCPRQWFYARVVAHHAAKDPLRREAYLLSKLDSLWSWRGRLVDDVISRHAVPALAWGRDPDAAALLDVAWGRYEAQLAFAAAHRLREPALRPSRQPNFLALREVEWGAPPGEADLAKAWRDIETALTNLLAMAALLEHLKGATFLLPQRALTYRHPLLEGASVTVRAVPDLLAFFRDAPPLIVDWKVHTHASASYREQLAGYALALKRADGQRGLPRLGGLKITDVALVEAQLLTGELRHYRLTDEDVGALEARLSTSATGMKTVLNSADGDPYAVPPTTDLRTCDGCNFKAPCWQGFSHPTAPRSPGSP